MRLVLTGGGTGGHVYPALAVAQALPPGEVVLYIGSSQGLEAREVPRAGVPFACVEAGRVLGQGWGAAGGLARAGAGVWQARRLLREVGAQAVLGTGGYVTAPVGVAAALSGIPLMVLEANARPGLTNRWLAYLSREVAVPWPEVRQAFPSRVRGRVVVTGLPVRPAILRASRQEARRALGVGDQERVVLALGGSLGAWELNRALLAWVRPSGPPAGVHLVWVTGARYHAQVTSSLGQHLPRVRVQAYLDEEAMAQALAAADLVVARAGAATLAELSAWGLPAILVPSPNVTQDHQSANARIFARRGAAVVLREEALGRLGQEIGALLADGARLVRMAQASRSLGRPQAATQVAERLRRLAGRGRRQGV
jgi:UDP-N-acetylglucosamine--N-acetylmuramyl-(pentapeptide) pyrophosphoryl-undecaprenol N-acetylglucosamine transferase